MIFRTIFRMSLTNIKVLHFKAYTNSKTLNQFKRKWVIKSFKNFKITVLLKITKWINFNLFYYNIKLFTINLNNVVVLFKNITCYIEKIIDDFFAWL